MLFVNIKSLIFLKTSVALLWTQTPPGGSVLSVDYTIIVWTSEYMIKKNMAMQSMRSLYGVACDINPFGLIIILTDLKDCLSFVG